jgi:hypothetical protein
VSVTGADDARYADLQHQGALTGRRLVLRYSPADAVRLGADQLIAQGFAPREEDLDAALRAEGSPWTARALRIGDRRKSWRRGIVADLVEEFVPVDLIPGLRRGIAPTVAVVTARALPDGLTELYVVPLSARTGDPQASFGAAPLVRAAIAGVRSTAEQAGAFVSADAPILGVADPECPASRAKATQLLGTL